MALEWMLASVSRGMFSSMKMKVVLLVIALLVLAAMSAKFAASRSGISLNESALYPEDI